MVIDSNDETNFPHKLLLTTTQVSTICKAFANGSSANLKLSKTQLSKMVQLRGFLFRLLGPLTKTGLPLIENVYKSLAKSFLIPLGLTAATSATDMVIQTKTFGSGMTISITLNEEMDDIMKIVKSLKESDLLIKDISETIENEAKGQKVGVLGMLLGTLGTILFGNLLTGKGGIRAGEGVIRAVEADQDF